MPLSCNFRAVRLFSQRPHLSSLPVKSAPSRAQRSPTSWPWHRRRTSEGIKLDAPCPRVQQHPSGRPERYASIVGEVSIMEFVTLLCVCAVAVEPKIMHVMIRCRPMGAPGWFKAPGGRQQRVNQNLRDTGRAIQVTDRDDCAIRARATGLSADPRSATIGIFRPRASITIVARQLAQTGGRCSTLPRFKGTAPRRHRSQSRRLGSGRTSISFTFAPQCRGRSWTPSSRRRLYGIADSAAGRALGLDATAAVGQAVDQRFGRRSTGERLANVWRAKRGSANGTTAIRRSVLGQVTRTAAAMMGASAGRRMAPVLVRVVTGHGGTGQPTRGRPDKAN